MSSVIPSKVVADFKGLVLAPGQLSRPASSFITANNVNFDAPGSIRKRQGQARQTTTFGGPIWKMVSDKQLGSNILFNWGTNAGATALGYADGTGGAPTTFSGTFNNGPAHRLQSAIGRTNHYLTTDDGVRRLHSDLSIYFAGLPQGLQLDQKGPAAVLTGGTGGFLADGAACAYRVTWCLKDAEGSIMEGAPSARSVVYNNTRTTGYSAGNAQNVVARVLVPKAAGTGSTALTTSYFFRLYRSVQDAGGFPGDDMFLVYEAYLSAGDIATGYVDVTDNSPDTYILNKAPALHTNPNLGGDVGVGGSGIGQANSIPPKAYTAELFAQCLWYGNVTFPHSYTFTILGVGSSGNTLQANDIITIAGRTYTAKAAPAADPTNEFGLVTTGSASENVERTAQNLVAQINKDSGNTLVWAFYISGPNDLPGKILLQARGLNDSGNLFSISVSAHGQAYRPSLVNGDSSTASTFHNGLVFSKQFQGDAVPVVNLIFIGRNDTTILATKALRESLYVFTDSGVYRIKGTSFADFSVQEFELTFRLLGSELVTSTDDALWAWGREGIARITSAGIEYISNAIEPYLWNAINASSLQWMQENAFAVAYLSRHKVLFFFPLGTTNRNCPNALVYDTRMKAWSTYSFSASGPGAAFRGRGTGCIRYSDDLLCVGQWNPTGANAFFYKERRTYAAADYQDDLDDGTTTAIQSALVFVPQLASPDMLVVWDEIHLGFEVSEIFSAWTTPSAVIVSCTADDGTSGGATAAPAASWRTSRQIISNAARMSSRLKIQLVHQVQAEFFGLEALTVHYIPEGNVTVRQ